MDIMDPLRPAPLAIASLSGARLSVSHGWTPDPPDSRDTYLEIAVDMLVSASRSLKV